MTMPRIFAHQGGAAQWPGNSQQAFEAIVERNVDGVELDIHRSADGELLVIHDAVIGPPGGRTPVGSLSSAEIRHACGASGAGKSLKEILSLLQRGDFDIQIDVKTDAYGVGYPDIIPDLAETIVSAGVLDSVIISSFLPDVLADARRHLARVRLRSGLMPLVIEQLGGALSAMDAYRAVGVEILDVNHQMLDERLGSEARARGMQVGVGTVNGASALAFWMRQPVDRIMTDEPDHALLEREKWLGRHADRPNGDYDDVDIMKF